MLSLVYHFLNRKKRATPGVARHNSWQVFLEIPSRSPALFQMNTVKRAYL